MPIDSPRFWTSAARGSEAADAKVGRQPQYSSGFPGHGRYRVQFFSSVKFIELSSAGNKLLWVSLDNWSRLFRPVFGTRGLFLRSSIKSVNKISTYSDEFSHPIDVLEKKMNLNKVQ